MEKQETINEEARVESGFVPLEPHVNMRVAIRGSVMRLSHTPRYSTFRQIWKEDVAQHSFYHGFFAWMVASDLKHRGYAVFPAMVVEAALMGDLEEALTGDLITIFKNARPELKSAAKRVGEDCTDAMFEEFGGAAWHLDQIRKMDHLNQWEAAAVKFADLLCVVAHATQEYCAGNQAFQPVLRDIHRDMGKWREDEMFGPYIEQLWPNDRWQDPVAEPFEAVHRGDRYPKVGQ